MKASNPIGPEHNHNKPIRPGEAEEELSTPHQSGAIEPEPPKPINVALLRDLAKSMPLQSVDAGTFVRWMRDTDRY